MEHTEERASNLIYQVYEANYSVTAIIMKPIKDKMRAGHHAFKMVVA